MHHAIPRACLPEGARRIAVHRLGAHATLLKTGVHPGGRNPLLFFYQLEDWLGTCGQMYAQSQVTKRVSVFSGLPEGGPQQPCLRSR
eukprot:1161361-Pelagomonas_calceolata.AAC.18